MALDFDTSRAPMRPEEYEGLVRAVLAARSGDESVWVEWKSGMDLGSAEGKATVVRCLVGLANRQPDVAGRFCEGRGYLVVGAAPGELTGVDEADPADLSNWWRPYLGDEGPRWSPHWVLVDDHIVLIVEVAAPRTGDPVHSIRKEGGGTGKGAGIRDGDIFIRHPGQTEKVTSRELDALIKRATTGQRLSGLRVSLGEPEAVPVVDMPLDAAVSRWIDEQRQKRLHSLREHQRPHPAPRPTRNSRSGNSGPAGLRTRDVQELERRQGAGETLTDDELASLEEAHALIANTMSQIAQNFMPNINTVPEARSADEYEAQIEQYLQECRIRLPGVLRALAAKQHPVCRFALHNDTETNFPAVEVVLHVPGDIEAVAPDDSVPDLPAPPTPYGPKTKDPFNIGSALMPSLLRPPNVPALWIGQQVRIENSGSVTLHFDPVNLRPRKTVMLPDLVLLPQANASDSITATWQATSTGLDGVARGETVIALKRLDTSGARDPNAENFGD